MNFVALKMLTADRAKFCCTLIALGLALFAAAPLYGQSESGARSPGTYGAASFAARDNSAPDLQQQSPYLGGVPTGTASSTPLQLSLEDAVTRGLRQNLGGLLSSDVVSGAQGERWQALSALLPNLTTATSFGVRQVDLKATIGINVPVPGVPPVTGPFGVFDTRAYLDQSVFNWESIERARSSAAQVKSAQYSYKNARELIVLVVVSNYLLVIADQSQVESALAQRDTAKALFDQTTDQKTAGLAAAVDVLRSDVELQQREQSLIVARNNLAKQKLVLARAIGLPAGQAFDITTRGRLPAAYDFHPRAKHCSRPTPLAPTIKASPSKFVPQSYKRRPLQPSVTRNYRQLWITEISAPILGTAMAQSTGSGCSGSPFSREAGSTEITWSQIRSWQGPGNGWKTSAPASTRKFVTLSLTCKIPPRKCRLRNMPSSLPLRPCSNHVIASPRA